MTLKVFVAGEGANEVGTLARDPAYADAAPYEGFIQVFLSLVWPENTYEVVGGCAWKSIRKFVAGRGRKKGLAGAEQRTVAKLRLRASEGADGGPGADAVVFLRDSDCDQKRTEAIRIALEEPGLPSAGGVPERRLESWLLALTGVTNTESLPNGVVDARLSACGVPPKDTGAQVALVRKHGLSNVAPDAKSLRDWRTSLERLQPSDVSAR